MEDRARDDQADRDDETLLGDADALDGPSIESSSTSAFKPRRGTRTSRGASVRFHVTDLTPSPRQRPSRRAREQRAYRVVQVGGVAAVLAAVGLVLAVVGVISFGLPILAAVVAAVCAVLFRRSVGA